MEDIIKDLINRNNRYQWEILQENEKIEIKHTIPKYPLLILTCMDPRIDIHRIFQLEPGDAVVLRNAGNQYTEDVLRSMLIAVHEYNVKNIVVLGHLDCGMRKIHLDQLKHKLSPQALKQIGQYGTNYQLALQRFFKAFTDEISNINNQKERLKVTKGIPSEVNVYGMLYDPFTGWAFSENEFRKYSSYESFMLNYQKLLHKKKMNQIDFLESIEGEIVGTEQVKPELTIEKPEVVEVLNEIVKTDEDFNLKSEYTRENDLIDIQKILKKNTEVIEKSLNIVSKIQIPKIYIPKISVHVPKVNKYRKKV